MKNDPFAQLGALDQKLFHRPTATPVQSKPQAGPAVPQSNGPAPVQSRTPAVPQSRGPAVPQENGSSLFNPEQTPEREVEYRVSQQEFEAMEDLLFDLKRKYGLSNISKAKVPRCALHHLFEDYHANGERSLIVRLLKSSK